MIVFVVCRIFYFGNVLFFKFIRFYDIYVNEYIIVGKGGFE